jgi:hypothetical protein
MTALADRAAQAESVGTTELLDVEIVVPVFNEEADLGPSVRRLHRFLRDYFPFTAMITIADNASTDRTWERAGELAAPGSSPTWTSTCRPTSTRCCHSSRR